MTIKFLEKNQVWQNETTEYWFDLDGTVYNMCDNNGRVRLYDSENYPIDLSDTDHDRIYELLYPEYQKHISD